MNRWISVRLLLQNVSTITTDNCRCFLNSLNALHNFLQSNTQLSIGCDPSSAASTSQQQIHSSTLNLTSGSRQLLNHTVHDAQIEERKSLNSLKLFIGHCCQILGLWRILCEHQFHILIGSLPDSQQHILQNTTFKDLFLYGQDICSVLITTLVDSYLGDNASVDSISAKLRDVCPHLYRIEDAAFSKVGHDVV